MVVLQGNELPHKESVPFVGDVKQRPEVRPPVMVAECRMPLWVGVAGCAPRPRPRV